jgi:hypothetical protein
MMHWGNASFSGSGVPWEVPVFSAVVGHSEEADGNEAVEEILQQCRAKLDGAVPRAGLLFAAIDFDHHALLCGITQAFPGIELVGCTTDGELSSELGFREDSATLILFASDTVDIAAGVGRGLSGDVAAACRAAVEAAQAKTDKPLRLCIATPEGMTAEGHSVTATLQQAVGHDIPLFGALAGDQWRLKSTRQFYGTEVLTDSIPVLLLCGEFHFAFGVATGWRQVGEVGHVTRAAGATVHEIDGKPAIDFYRKYLGPGTKPTAEVPLAILSAGNASEYLRASWGVVDETTGAVTFLATVPEGARVRLTLADRDEILTGCGESLAIAKSNFPVGLEPAAALFFSCAARKILLGTRTPEELKLIRKTLGETVPICGFYGYGEISPNMGDASGTKYHNESFVTLLIAE